MKDETAKIEFSIKKYLMHYVDYFGDGDASDVWLTKLEKGKVYVSDGKPCIDKYGADFDCGYVEIHKAVGKALPLKKNQPRKILEVINELEETK